MTQPETHAIYGLPPRELAPMPAGAQQFSPLMPGSLRMADFAPASIASAIIYAPPGTIERRYVLARMLTALSIRAPLIALAPKDKGGSRIAKELTAFGCEVVESSKQHHRIVTTSRPAQLNGIEEAIAAGGLQQHPSHGQWTHPGVFSWDRTDEGSALLLKRVPTFTGRGADFGCGIGILSLAVLASEAVRELTLIDIDRRAIAAAQKNIADARAKFMWADIRDTKLPTADLDFIIMNPPFHDAGVEDKSLGQQFITRAAGVLKSGGKLWLTANRHLPYEALLAKLFARVAVVDEADGFKIFSCEK